MDALIDMHSHLDFADSSQNIASDAEKIGISTICSTVTPASFVSAKSAFFGFPSIRISLGLHPWWIGDGRIGQADVNRFESLIEKSPYIGEIGLDFGVRHKGSLEHQITILDRLLSDIDNSRIPHLITLHCVKSTNVVLDKLEEHGVFKDNDIIFHWFSGHEDDLARACSMGAHFSIGMKMLATKSGRRFAQAIPISSLLLESDDPPHEGTIWSADIWKHELEGALRDISELRNMDEEDLRSIMMLNSSKLLETYDVVL